MEYDGPEHVLRLSSLAVPGTQSHRGGIHKSSIMLELKAALGRNSVHVCVKVFVHLQSNLLFYSFNSFLEKLTNDQKRFLSLWSDSEFCKHLRLPFTLPVFFVSLLFSFARSVKVNLGHFTATINMLMCVNRNTWLWCSSHFIPLVTKANQQSTFLLQKSQDGLLASLMNLHIPYSGGLFCDSRPFFLPKWHSSSMNWLPGHDFSELFTDSWQWRLPVGLWRSDTENADLLL